MGREWYPGFWMGREKGQRPTGGLGSIQSGPLEGMVGCTQDYAPGVTEEGHLSSGSSPGEE